MKVIAQEEGKKKEGEQMIQREIKYVSGGLDILTAC
jgi:hypothetical protein